MHQVHLSDQLYQQAQRRAAEGGFGTVDDYIVDLLKQDLEAPDDFDRLFTPERLAHIERSAAEIDNGHGLTLDQLDAELGKRREAWRRQNSG